MSRMKRSLGKRIDSRHTDSSGCLDDLFRLSGRLRSSQSLMVVGLVRVVVNLILIVPVKGMPCRDVKKTEERRE
jgi:hypothetical protein